MKAIRERVMSDPSILTLTEDDFDERISSSRQPILVDFWASWCSPCRRLAPQLEQLAEELSGRVRIAKVDVDQNGDLANRFGIRSIPTLVMFKHGKVVDQMIGNVPKDQLRALIEKHV